LSAHHTDGPRAPGGQSARRLSASSSSCSSCVLVCLSFNPFCRTVRVGVDGPRAHRGRSVIERAVLEVQGLFSDGPSQPRG
jgi:hypothetical protein